MTDQPPRDDRPTDPLRSPVRPTPPTPQSAPDPAPTPTPPAQPSPVTRDPAAALNLLRSKMETIADEFAQGKINSVQFHMLYRRHSEQRAIIEKLIERNPDSDAWQRVVGTGQTGFLRSQYAAQPLYYAVFRVGIERPMQFGGKQTANEPLLSSMAAKLWALRNRPNPGLARKALPSGQWVIIATGEYAGTFVVFSMEPSNAQARLVRDLHADFERANAASFQRGQFIAERMVFPQRALAEGSV